MEKYNQHRSYNFFEVKDINSLQCSSGNPITSICLNPQCKTALKCSDPTCSTCGISIHAECRLIYLSEFTGKVNKKIYQWRQFLKKIAEVEEQCIAKIHRERQQFYHRYTNVKFKQIECGTLINILNGRIKLSSLSSQEFLNIMEHLERKRVQNDEEKDHSMIEQYKKQLKKQTNAIKRLKETIFLPEKIPQTLIQKSIYEKGIKNVTQILSSTPSSISNTIPPIIKQPLLDSEVLKMRESVDEDIHFLMKTLKEPVLFKLIFRASKYQFKASRFHGYCDDVNDTLVLVRTQFGKTIGGYSHYQWNTVKNAYVSGQKRRAFLLQLDLRQQLIPFRDKELVYCNSENGPTFGGGADLKISDKCNIVYNSYSNPGFTYNVEGPEKYKWDQQKSWSAFSGAKNGKYFRVIEYQVFKVIWKND